MSEILQKLIFKINSFKRLLMAKMHLLPYLFAGLKIGRNCEIGNASFIWPHQTRLGNNCKAERNVFFKYVGTWNPGPSIILMNNIFIGSNVEFNISKRVSIGNDCLIASGCKFIDHDHGITSLDKPINVQPHVESEIIINDNVWLGYNVIILKGVEIGKGAVIAAGSVVTKSIPPKEIWGGIPAAKITQRE